jgi:hypothetical protein
MGGQTSKQIADNITNNISSTINKTLISVCNNANVSQSFVGGCSTNDISILTKAANTCISTLSPLVNNTTFTAKDVFNQCSVFLNICSAENISFDQTLIWTSDTQVNNTLESMNSNDIKNSLAQFQSSKTDQEINNLVDNISTIKNEIAVAIINSVSAQQSVTVDAFSIKNVSFKQSTTVITNVLIKNKSIADNINKISNIIVQSSQDTSNTILTVGIIIIALFVLVFLIITMSKSKDLKDFFIKAIPSFIFIITAFLITIMHIALKPAYVTYIDGDGNVQLDKSKMILFLSIYYIALIFLIWLIFYIKSKSNSKSVTVPN